MDGATLLGGKTTEATLTMSLLSVLGPRGITIIALIICVSIVIVIAFLLAAVCFVRRRRHHYQKAARGLPLSSCNGDKYNCRVEALRALKDATPSPPTAPVTTELSLHSPLVRSVVQTLDSSPRTPSGRVVLVASGPSGTDGGGGLTASKWNGSAGQPCRRQLLPAAPDLVARTSGADQTLSTFGKTLPPSASTKRTLSTSDVSSTTPDVKVCDNAYTCRARLTL